MIAAGNETTSITFTWLMYAKIENIGFDGYIGTCILWIYRIYIGGYCCPETITHTQIDGTTTEGLLSNPQ